MKSNEIQVLDPIQRREKGERGLLINEWENLAAPSNRRLTHQNLRFLFSLSWSIDRITIVGNLKEFEFDHTFVTEDGEIFYRAGEKFTQSSHAITSERGSSRASWQWLAVVGQVRREYCLR